MSPRAGKALALVAAVFLFAMLALRFLGLLARVFKW